MREVHAARRFLVIATALGLASTAAVVAQAVLLAAVITAAVVHHRGLGSLAPLLLGLAGAFAARAVLGWCATLAAEHTAGTLSRELRGRMVAAATELGPQWLAGERAGELSLTATRGITSLEIYFGRYLPQLVLAAVAPAAILVWVGYEDWVSLAILLALLACIPPVMIAFGRRARTQTARQWRTLGSLASRFLELIEGLPTLRAFGQEERGREEVATATERLRTTTNATLRVAFLSSLSLDLLAGLGTGLVAMVLGLRLLDGGVALGTALAVLLVSPEVFIPLRRAATEFHASTEGQAAAARVLDVMATVPRSPDLATKGGVPQAPRNSPGPAALPPWDPAVATIALRRITVHYPKRATAVVDHLDLEIAPGDHIAVTGPSGAGKSTLLHLLLCFLQPDEGAVEVGGTDLATIDPVHWRRRVSWVPQRPHLFRGTLAQNLWMDFADPAPAPSRYRSLGIAPGPGSVDAEAVESVLERTGLDAVVARLPAGLWTPVGPGGTNLSGGERQLVAVGRALLRDTPLVLLDEPTAHLDLQAATRVRALLGTWGGGKTVVVATHEAELAAGMARCCALDDPVDQARTVDDPDAGAPVLPLGARSGR